MSKIIITRMKRYGGVHTFFQNFTEQYPLNEKDLIFLEPDIDKNILFEIKKTKSEILFYPIAKGNIIYKMFINNIYIFYKLILLNKKKKYKKIIYTNWNIIYDFISLFIKKESLAFVHTYPNRNLPNLFKKVATRKTKHIKIVTVSKYSSNKINECWLENPQNNDVLYNFSSKIYNFSRRNIPKKNIICIAHCEEYKNPYLWLEVATSLTKRDKNLNFIWVGDGLLYKDLLSRTVNNQNIHFIGYRNQVEINEILQTAYIYTQFSTRESLGISILDAMNYGLPCIVSNVGGMPELVENGNNGFVCSNSEEIINKVLRIKDDDRLYQKLSGNSKNKYEENFSKDIWINKLKCIMN